MARFDADLRRLSSGPLPERIALAARADARQELLLLLAADEALPVRLAVAANPGAPSPADQLLARDPVASIRASLARKLAAHAAEMAGFATLARPWDVLRRLARDQAWQVRHAVSDTLADLPEAPHDLVLGLALDAEPAVSEPLIRLSRVLTETDLLGLVRSPPVVESRRAVARRLNLPEAVAAALVLEGDGAALLAVLRNPTARLSPPLLGHLAVLARSAPELGKALASRLA